MAPVEFDIETAKRRGAAELADRIVQRLKAQAEHLTISDVYHEWAMYVNGTTNPLTEED